MLSRFWQNFRMGYCMPRRLKVKIMFAKENHAKVTLFFLFPGLFHFTALRAEYSAGTIYSDGV
jgi:hypothetical protein